MRDAVLLTAEGGGPEAVLPGLMSLPLDVSVAPMSPPSLIANLDAPLIILDGRHDLDSAREACDAVAGSLQTPPILLVVDEEGYAVVSASWGVADTVLHSAPPAEIHARIRIAREHAEARASRAERSLVVHAGELVIDPGAFEATVEGQVLELTFKEFELLHYLALRPGRVVSRETLLEEVWGYDYFGGSRTVDVHVRRLRAKLGASHKSLISTVRNVGYRFEPGGRRGRAGREPRR
ncbi:MAG: response regulator transcription factor [Actinomycetaceae bacterium]|nr:response regulator transcription factor [Actinomycetaceae bacterium]